MKLYDFKPSWLECMEVLLKKIFSGICAGLLGAYKFEQLVQYMNREGPGGIEKCRAAVLERWWGQRFRFRFHKNRSESWSYGRSTMKRRP